ncbi:hypothetical protein [Acetivibrio saccincola]|uniref:Uncharacterized protein n=1 Tax=Acetivibrio saccincola TaxID=1677857 RepID=A0A2K9EKB9_9FIRM|nr:hypothetical protein [Acetivibrio saccincola]AUG58443.1 hypothetical protein HVS_12850 [Acetivibrio saccincola]
MANKNNKNNIKDERIEDTTRYGEFISSFHQWIAPEKQREKARYLAEVTKNKSETNKKQN